MILGKYVNWDRAAEELIRAHSDNAEALKLKREQLKELKESTDGLNSIRYDLDRVQSSPTEDIMVNALIQRQELERAVHDLEIENRMYIKAWGFLSDDEKNILQIFFQQGLAMEDAACMLCEQYHCDRATIYRKRRAAVKRFKRFLIE